MGKSWVLLPSEEFCQCVCCGVFGIGARVECSRLLRVEIFSHKLEMLSIALLVFGLSEI